MRRNVVILLVLALLMNVLAAGQASIAAGNGALMNDASPAKCMAACCDPLPCCMDKGQKPEHRETSPLPANPQSKLMVTFTVLMAVPMSVENGTARHGTEDVSSFLHSPPPRLRSGIQLI